MKIIHIITAFGIGGAEKLLLNVINKQIEEHEVHLVYLKPKDDLIYLLDKRVITKKVSLSLSVFKNLKQYLTKEQPNIVHTHLGHADILGIWSARDLSSKVFCTMHNIYFKKNILDAVFLKIYQILFLKVVKKGVIISISKSVEKHVLKRLKIPKDRSFLLYNAIPNSDFSIKKNKPSKKINLLFVGRLEKQKSIETLLKAIQLLSKNKGEYEFQLQIIGEGKLRAKLEQHAIDLQISHLVTFEGEQKDVNPFFINSQIFILPSIWEGFGIVILEAFRAKLAVIASDIEGPSELIVHNKNGLLFKPLDDIDLADKIKELIHNKEKRKSVAQEGFNSFTKKIHIDSYVEKLNNLYINV